VLAKKSYDVKADIFSLGVLFWQLVLRSEFGLDIFIPHPPASSTQLFIR
jgi:hypothetical protein